jgi:hypothetical protein
VGKEGRWEGLEVGSVNAEGGKEGRWEGFEVGSRNDWKAERGRGLKAEYIECGFSISDCGI